MIVVVVISIIIAVDARSTCTRKWRAQCENLYLFCAGGLGSRNFRLPCDPSPESAASTVPCVYQPSGDLGNSARGKKQCLISPSTCLPNIQHHTDSCHTAGNACIHAYRHSYFCVCIHAYMHAYIQPYVCACMHACTHAYKNMHCACMHVCSHAYVRAYMNT